MKSASSQQPLSRLTSFSRIATNGLLLFILWVLFSAKFDAFHLGTGVATVLILLWMQASLPALRDEPESFPKFLPVLLYVPWILTQMVLSAIVVAKIILLKPQSVEPVLLTFHCRQPSALQQVLFANSITLTPGTLTIEMEKEVYFVHALTRATADDLLDGKMARRIARLSDQSADAPLSVKSDPPAIPAP